MLSKAIKKKNYFLLLINSTHRVDRKPYTDFEKLYGKTLFWWKFQFFAYLPKILSQIKENLSQVQNMFTFNAINVFKKYILMFGKLAMTC